MSGWNLTNQHEFSLIMDLNRVSGLYANPTATVREYLLQSFRGKPECFDSPKLMGHLGGKHLKFFNRLQDVFYEGDEAKETLKNLGFYDKSQTSDDTPHYWINRKFIFDEAFAKRIADVMYVPIMHQLGKDAYYLHMYRFLNGSIPEEQHTCAYVEHAFRNECRYQRIADDVANEEVNTNTRGAFLRCIKSTEKLFEMRLVLRHLASGKDKKIIEDVNTRLDGIQKNLESIRGKLQQ